MEKKYAYQWNSQEGVLLQTTHELGQGSRATLTFLPSQTENLTTILQNLPEKLGDRRWGIYTDAGANGEFSISFTAYGGDQELIGFLQQQGWVPATEPKKARIQDEKPASLKERVSALINKHAMRLLGFLAAAGHTGVYMRGKRESELIDMMAEEHHAGEQSETWHHLHDKIMRDPQKAERLDAIENYLATNQDAKKVACDKGGMGTNSVTMLSLIDQGMDAKELASIVNGSRHNASFSYFANGKEVIRMVFGAGKESIDFPKMLEAMHTALEQEGLAVARPADHHHLLSPDQAYTRTPLQEAYSFTQRNAVQVAELVPLITDTQMTLRGVSIDNLVNRAKEAVSGKGAKVENKEQIPETEPGAPTRTFKNIIVNFADLFLGISNSLGRAIAFFVPETKEGEDLNSKDQPWYKRNAVYQWVAARPLKIQGWLSLSNKVFLIRDAASHSDKERRAWSMFTAVTYTVARVFNALASKLGEAPDSLDAYQDLFAMAADSLSTVPEQNREQAIARGAEILAPIVQAQMAVYIDDMPAQIQQHLTEKVEALVAHSAWAAVHGREMESAVSSNPRAESAPDIPLEQVNHTEIPASRYKDDGDKDTDNSPANLNAVHTAALADAQVKVR